MPILRQLLHIVKELIKICITLSSFNRNTILYCSFTIIRPSFVNLEDITFFMLLSNL